MIAYNEEWLYHVYLRSQAEEALQEQLITPEMYDAIHKAKDAPFYTPNFFVRIGLGVLTLIITIFVLGLFALMSGSELFSMPFLLVFVGVCSYVAAELLIRSKKHYNSGVDNMLVWMAALLLWSGVVWQMGIGSDPSVVAMSFAGFAITIVLAMRFADTVLSLAATVAILCFAFYSYQHTGTLARYTTPFFMILISGVLYIVSARVGKMNSLFFYRNCFKCINVAALVALYASGNYYLVKELSNEMFNLGLRLGDPLPMGWFFWSWTFLVPLIYIGIGIRNKEVTFIRTGILLVAVAVLTFRYYHSILSPEMAMMLGGMLLFVLSYSLISYLREPKKGFSFTPEKHISDKPNIGQVITSGFIDNAASGTKDTWE